MEGTVVHLFRVERLAVALDVVLRTEIGLVVQRNASWLYLVEFVVELFVDGKHRLTNKVQK